jgi:quinol-cytochrome oxidoreductase complex cytochrome b subunit
VFGSPIWPETTRERRAIVRHYFFLHLRPVLVRADTLRLTHTWGLGGSTAVLLAVLLVTGILQMLAYEATPAGAYDSLAELRSGTRFGSLVQSVHHWSANLVVVVAGLHLLRVLLTGGLQGPRQFNWVLGVGLLLGVLAANFTGYLLPWDQLAYWAVTICTGMLDYVPGIGGWLQDLVRGGDEVGATTLTLFFMLHTTVIPIGLLVLMGFHFWRVRKAGGVVPPRSAGPLSERSLAEGGAGSSLATAEVKVEFVPNLLLREAAVGAVVVAAVLLMAVFLPASPGEPANPGMSPNPAKAPWYFLGFQELQLHFHPLFSVVILPALALFGLISLPYLAQVDGRTAGVVLASAVGRRSAAIAALVALTATPLLVLASDRWQRPGGWLPGAPPPVGEGLVPSLLVFGGAGAVLWLLRRRLDLGRPEIVQAGFAMAAVALVVLTVVGVVFRGEGMMLVWPW